MKKTFEQSIETNFEGLEFDYEQRVEAGHHRREIRKLWVMPLAQLGGLYQQSQWTGLQWVRSKTVDKIKQAIALSSRSQKRELPQ